MKTLALLISMSLSLATVSATPGTLEPAAGTNVKPPSIIFNFVHAHRQGSGITVAWSSTVNNTVVSSFTVMRTYEDPNDPYAVWDVVNMVPCNNGRNYRSTDLSVSPGTISYVVVANLTGGGNEVSEIRTVRIVQR
ncbi:MAG TPA: hypothetical protein VFV31_11390 [Chitinophagaceae bacterium]|nr:hypothetical protein [Chitinophagaceae bacterium]